MDFDKDKFYLGKLCNHNHKWNELEQSLRYRSSNICTECSKKSIKAYREANKQKLCEVSKKYNQENSDKVKKRKKAYREANKEKIQDYQQKWHKVNKERTRVYNSNYHSMNREEIHKRQKHYRKLEQGKSAISRGHRNRKARKQSIHLVKYTDQQLKERYEQFSNCCSYCLKETKLFRDHFIPVSKGGSDCLGNIVPACLTCNSSKHDSDPMTWYKSQDFYSPTQWKKILKILGKTELNYTQIPLF